MNKNQTAELIGKFSRLNYMVELGIRLTLLGAFLWGVSSLLGTISPEFIQRLFNIRLF